MQSPAWIRHRRGAAGSPETLYVLASLLCAVLPLGKKQHEVTAVGVGVAGERSAAEVLSEVIRD